MPCRNSHDSPLPSPRNLVPRPSPSFGGGAFPTAPPPPEGEALGMRLPRRTGRSLLLLLQSTFPWWWEFSNGLYVEFRVWLACFSCKKNKFNFPNNSYSCVWSWPMFWSFRDCFLGTLQVNWIAVIHQYITNSVSFGPIQLGTTVVILKM